MEIDSPKNFKHTTLDVFPETPLGGGKYTPKVVGITLLDEDAKHTGVYLRDANGGLWPARTVCHKPVKHHRDVCAAWLAREGVHEDKRSVRP